MDDLRVEGTRSLYFDGSSGRVSLGNHERLQCDGIITIEACVWNGGDARQGQMSRPYKCIVAHGHDGSTEVFLRANQFNQSYEVGCWTAVGDATCLASSKIPPSDYKTWVHLAGVYDGTSWLLYRNGALVAQAPGRFGAHKVLGSEWAIGSKGGGGERFFKGSMAYVSIWNVARSQAEIEEGMHSEREGDEEGLLAHWPLDEGGGINVRDAAGECDGKILGDCKWALAVPEEDGNGDSDREYYGILGVSKDASTADIKKAYKTLALKYHPDRNPGEENEARFKKMKDAFDVLVDPEKRAVYDALGEEGLENGGGAGMSAMNPLEEMLMRSMGINVGGGGLPKARDAVHELQVTLEELYTGAEKELHIEKIDSPRASRKPDTIKVHVDKGMLHGSKITFRDGGDHIPGQCLPGDRIVVLGQAEHSRFQRKGDDLLLKHSIPLGQSLTRTGKIFIRHLDGRVLVSDVPDQIIAAGAVMKVDGEGMPVKGQPFEKGDLYIQFDVEFPETLDEETVAKLKDILPAAAPPPDSKDLEDAEWCEMRDGDLEELGANGAMGGSSAHDDDEHEHEHAGPQCAQQ